MKFMRDYKCKCCGNMEERISDSESVSCEACDGRMVRVIGMPRIGLDGTDAAFPTAYDRWARVRADNARIKASRS